MANLRTEESPPARDTVHSEHRRNKGETTMSGLMLDVGQANELKMAFRRAGYSNDEIKQLCEGNILVDVRNVLRKRAAITMVEHVIDCDANPFVPDDWKVEEHQKGGQLRWDVSRVQLFLAEGQQNGKALKGSKLRKKLVGKPVLNANVLDYLLVNPHLIPEEWRGKVVFFWGTIYRRSDGFLYVRCLRWEGGDVCFWDHNCLGNAWYISLPAAVRTS